MPNPKAIPIKLSSRQQILLKQIVRCTTNPHRKVRRAQLILAAAAGKSKVKYHQVGNLYGLRNWVEYGLKQSTNELGWADFRVTDYAQTEKWWELVMSAYLLVSLHALPLHPRTDSSDASSASSIVSLFSHHPYWNQGSGWKNHLNNLRLILQPFVLFNLIRPWLTVFSIPALLTGFSRLIAMMNFFPSAIPRPLQTQDFHFFAA